MVTHTERGMRRAKQCRWWGNIFHSLCAVGSPLMGDARLGSGVTRSKVCSLAIFTSGLVESGGGEVGGDDVQTVCLDLVSEALIEIIRRKTDTVVREQTISRKERTVKDRRIKIFF